MFQHVGVLFDFNATGYALRKRLFFPPPPKY